MPNNPLPSCLESIAAWRAQDTAKVWLSLDAQLCLVAPGYKWPVQRRFWNNKWFLEIRAIDANNVVEWHCMARDTPEELRDAYVVYKLTGDYDGKW